MYPITVSKIMEDRTNDSNRILTSYMCGLVYSDLTSSFDGDFRVSGTWRVRRTHECVTRVQSNLLLEIRCRAGLWSRTPGSTVQPTVEDVRSRVFVVVSEKIVGVPGIDYLLPVFSPTHVPINYSLLSKVFSHQKVEKHPGVTKEKM